jgi:hypothetical protein
MEVQGKDEYSSYSFTISALDGVSGQRHDPVLIYPGTHWTGGWVGPTAGLDIEARGKSSLPQPGTEPRSTGHPVRSQTLY